MGGGPENDDKGLFSNMAGFATGHYPPTGSYPPQPYPPQTSTYPHPPSGYSYPPPTIHSHASYLPEGGYPPAPYPTLGGTCPPADHHNSSAAYHVESTYPPTGYSPQPGAYQPTADSSPCSYPPTTHQAELGSGYAPAGYPPSSGYPAQPIPALLDALRLLLTAHQLISSSHRARIRYGNDVS